MKIYPINSNWDSEAGYSIYSSEGIKIKNKNSLTKYEKNMILTMYSGCVNFNSFAAEVDFHADATEDMWAKIELGEGNRPYYNSAIRADITISAEMEHFGLFDDYYDLSSDLIEEQIKAHGEK